MDYVDKSAFYMVYVFSRNILARLGTAYFTCNNNNIHVVLGVKMRGKHLSYLSYRNTEQVLYYYFRPRQQKSMSSMYQLLILTIQTMFVLYSSILVLRTKGKKPKIGTVI